MDLPEVRQCTDKDSPYFGSVAVQSLVPFGKWLVGNPGPNVARCGGNWLEDEKLVEDWTPLGVELGGKEDADGTH